MSRPRSLKPTKQQAVIYDWIVSFKKVKGYPPTRKEIADSYGWRSPNAAQGHLEQLEMRGLLKLTPHVSRGIQILEAV